MGAQPPTGAAPGLVRVSGAKPPKAESFLAFARPKKMHNCEMRSQNFFYRATLCYSAVICCRRVTRVSLSVKISGVTESNLKKFLQGVPVSFSVTGINEFLLTKIDI